MVVASRAAHALRDGDQGVVGAAARHQLQARAAQRFVQRRAGFERAFDYVAGFACDQPRIHRQRHTRLAGDLVQGGGQRSGRQVRLRALELCSAAISVVLASGALRAMATANRLGRKNVSRCGTFGGFLNGNVSQCLCAERAFKSDRAN